MLEDKNANAVSRAKNWGCIQKGWAGEDTTVEAQQSEPSRLISHGSELSLCYGRQNLVRMKYSSNTGVGGSTVNNYQLYLRPYNALLA